ncbi:MAG: YkgJ family cysteine cluster protein [Deltaproteobacteria bacterium]|nr:YkgJ family cysteine cluster protein [Deltaproteobacteria bacterium]
MERARALGSPCLAGCHGCCHQLVLVELPDALLIARRLLAAGAVTAGLRRALEENATLVERSTPEDIFAMGGGCVFLDRGAPAAGCTIYEVRPNDCRTWFIHGVPDGRWCEPGAPARERPRLAIPELEEADVRHGARWVARFGTGLEVRPVWAPLALAVLAALDLLEHGPATLERWRERLDEATQRSYGFFEEEARTTD